MKPQRAQSGVEDIILKSIHKIVSEKVETLFFREIGANLKKIKR